MISACIITKNEKDNIGDLIQNLKGHFDEILVIDASDDGTDKIARDLGATVILNECASEQDFGLWRNFAIKKAKNDWIFMIDADERCSEKMLEEINNLTKEEQYDGFTFLWKNYRDKDLVEEIRKLVLFKRHGFYKDKIHENVQGLKKVANVGNEEIYISHLKTKGEQTRHFAVYRKMIEENLAKYTKEGDQEKIDYYKYQLMRQKIKEDAWLGDYI